MIKSWHVKNFKSIQDQTLKLAPLTILCGVNNSGKSSFIQSIALLVQSAMKNSGKNKSTKETPARYEKDAIVLKGDIFNFGSFDHIYNYKTKEDYESDINKNIPPIAFNFEVENDKNEKILFGFELKKAENKDNELQIDNSYIEYTGQDNKNYYFDTRKQDILDEVSKNEIEKKWENSIYPDSSFEVLYEKKAFKFDDTSLFPEYIRLVDIETGFTKGSPKINLPKNIEKPIRYLSRLFSSNIIDSPKFVFIGPVFDTFKNPKNTKTYKLLKRYFGKEKILNNYIPLDNYKCFDFEPKQGYKFEDAFNEWLVNFEIPDINNLDLVNLIDGINFSDEYDNFFELSQLGTGVSQILPILTTCLAAEPYSTIIISEPEAHLHPKLQSRLMDFFIAMALSNRQIIIETHSAYFIDWLCYKYIKTEQDELFEKLSIIQFTKKNELNKTTEFTEIIINEFGEISQWPENFFDENQIISSKSLYAAYNKRKKKDK